MHVFVSLCVESSHDSIHGSPRPSILPSVAAFPLDHRRAAHQQHLPRSVHDPLLPCILKGWPTSPPLLLPPTPPPTAVHRLVRPARRPHPPLRSPFPTARAIITAANTSPPRSSVQQISSLARRPPHPQRRSPRASPTCSPPPNPTAGCASTRRHGVCSCRRLHRYHHHHHRLLLLELVSSNQAP